MIPWFVKIGKAIKPYAKEILVAAFVAGFGKVLEKAKEAFDEWLKNKNNPDSSEAATE